MKNTNLVVVGKKIGKALAIFSITVGTIANANAAPHIDKSTEVKLIKICHALKSDSRIKLNRTIKQSRLGYKQIAAGLKCNGKSAMDFALLHNAPKTANYLARKANIDRTGMLAKRR